MAAEQPSSRTQFFPPSAAFTDRDIPADLEGKVYCISGANSGMGKELAQALYSRNAKVYVACRSEQRGKQAIYDITAAVPRSKGQLIFLSLDQADLNHVKAAAQTFRAQESRLDILFNNAGVMTGDSKPLKNTVQGHELALRRELRGTVPLNETADAGAASDGRAGDSASTLPRHQGCLLKMIARGVCYPVINGVYTQLFAAFSPATRDADWTTHWVIPWGRLALLRPDLTLAARSKEDGGNGNARDF